MNFPANRFIVGLPARDQYFYGREIEVNMILAQPWNWLCGQRRMGKTSLLFRLEAEARRRGWTPLFCSLAHLTPAASSGSVLLSRCLIAWRQELLRHSISPDDLAKDDPADAFVEIVVRLERATGNRVLFLFDEAEGLIFVENGDPGFLERLRAALERLECLSFVIAGTQLLADLFGRTVHCSPFLTAFRWRAVGPLDSKEALSLILADRTGGWAESPPAELVQNLVIWSGGHPYVLQEAGSQFEERVRRGEPPPTAEDWQSAVTANQGLRSAFKDDFVKLTITQQEVLTQLCRETGPVPFEQLCRLLHRPEEQVDEAVAFLENYGYIRKRNRACELRFGFYRRLTFNVVSSADQAKVSRIERKTMFVSYSHADANWLDRIRRFLHPAIAAGAIDDWSDRKVEPGGLWRTEIERALEHASVALLLVSQDFLTSKFVETVELPRLLARAASGSCRVLCLHVRPSSLSAPIPEGATNLKLLSDFQALNPPSRPLSSATDADSELPQIAAAIVAATSAP